MKKLILLLLGTIFLFSCSPNKEENKISSNQMNKNITYKDGTYSGTSKKDERGNTVSVEILVKNGKIDKVSMKNMDSNGKEKDEEYGKDQGQIKNKGFYELAQNSVNESKKYPEKLIQTQDIEKVDAISGATLTRDSFIEAVKNALEKAK